MQGEDEDVDGADEDDAPKKKAAPKTAKKATAVSIDLPLCLAYLPYISSEENR